MKRRIVLVLTIAALMLMALAGPASASPPTVRVLDHGALLPL